MDHIELAIAVLKKEIRQLKKEMDEEHTLPEVEEDIHLELTKLNRAVFDIQKSFLE